MLTIKPRERKVKGAAMFWWIKINYRPFPFTTRLVNCWGVVFKYYSKQCNGGTPRSVKTGSVFGQGSTTLFSAARYILGELQCASYSSSNIKGDTPWHLPLRQGSSDSSLSFLHNSWHHGKATLRDKLLLVGSHVQRTQRASTFLSTPGRIGALDSH